MKLFPLTFSKPHRFSHAHVLLVYGLVLLTGLLPSRLAADMLSTNIGIATGGGGGGANATTAPGAANAIDTAAATAQAHAHAQDMLSRNTMALEAVNAMQEAARAAAASATNAGANPNFPGQTLPDVPNGLVTGGLDINGAPIGANAPTQSLQNAHTIVTIQQTQQQALLNWNTFNVGRDTTVKFDQSAGGAAVGTWIAFNRITDPSGNPTQILGSIEAQGQVYIINQNGIIFGGASEVNTHAMVASALPLNDNLVTRGLLNNPDSQFLFSALAQPAGTNGPTPAFTPPSVPAFGKIGNVTVQAGAQITAPTSSSNVGGMVALIGPNVTNNGTISTPDGQTILAAGMQVGFSGHNSADPSLRGLDVYVGSVGTYGGTVTNGGSAGVPTGLIEAPRGSVVMAGKYVNQNGFIDSSTSVALNGRIDLLAIFNAIPNTNYSASNATLGGPFVYPSDTSTGVVSTGAGSVMQILPEWSSTAKINGTELALKSQINMQGQAVYLGAGSVVLAPNADVTVKAGVWNLLMFFGLTQNDFVSSKGQIYMDENAIIDVSGSTDVAASNSEYLLTVTLRAAELADAALQKNGSLRGQTITVDLRNHGTRADGTTWVGTPLANLNGYLGIVQRTVGELTTAGGTVTLTAGESVILQQGSQVNVSGGYQTYAAGDVTTSKLVVGGKLVDISKADPNVAYDGLYNGTNTVTDLRWGTTTTTTGVFAVSTIHEDAYSSGGNGGTLTITAPAMALDGSLSGSAITGPQQLFSAPEQGVLSLKFYAQKTDRAPRNLPFYSPTPPSIEFRSGSVTQTAAGAFALDGSGLAVALQQGRKDSVLLSADLLSSQGFGSLLIDNSDGNILLPTGVTLSALTGGSITLYGANLTINGTLSAPSGSLTLVAYGNSPYDTLIQSALGSSAGFIPSSSTRGKVIVGAGASISTAGLIINDRADAVPVQVLPHELLTTNAQGATTYQSTTKGGSVLLQGYTVELAAGSTVDVSGGVVAGNVLTYGNAGSISIKAGNDPLVASLMGGHLTLNATLKGYSGAAGGALTLQAPTIQVGGTATYANTLLLLPEFFSTGGFSQFTLAGLGADLAPPAATSFAPGVIIAPGTVIRPVVQSLQAAVETQSGASTILLTTQTLTEGYRNTASLTFTSLGITDFLDGRLTVRGGIVMGAGSSIETDALGSVTFQGQTVEMLGAVTTPGGVIKINGANHFPENTQPTMAYATVHIGSSSRLSAAGKTVLLADPYGRRVGHVYAGGEINVSGNIVADAGAVLNVSGTSSVLDLLPQEAGRNLVPLSAVGQMVLGAVPVATQVSSNGGLIALNGSQFLYSQATLQGLAGGATAQGGTLTVDSGKFIAPDAIRYDQDITLVVVQDMSTLPQPVFSPGSVVGQTLGGALNQGGYFGANSFLSGGFDSLKLAGNVQFQGAVSIAARGYLMVADGGVISADARVSLSAPYVTLGMPLLNPISDGELANPFMYSDPGTGVFRSYFGPTHGAGSFNVSADLVETGFLSFQNIGTANLTARQELRGNAYLDIAGDLTITAGQVYPTTASTFTITAYNYGASSGSVTLLSSGTTPAFPLSGGGRLNIYAASITQGGTLRAPLGTITLGWDGLDTAPVGLLTNASVPVTQSVTLMSGSVTSVSAINPQTGQGVLIPYGIIKDGTTWIDPTGLDITSSGVPDKTIRVSAASVTTQAGSVLDIRGGGELFGYRWVTGNGGTQDILSSNGSYAILPGYSSSYAPFAPFATSGLFVSNLGGDAGYTSSTLKVGDHVYLQGNALVGAGAYTLLPARYALLPGAMLITPTGDAASTSYVKPGGAAVTNGYLFNSLNPTVTGTVFEQFEIAPASVIQARAQYTSYVADTFIPSYQQQLNLPVSLTSYDAGYALLAATQSMDLNGGLQAAGALTGRGGRVDVSSPIDIVIAAPGAAPQSGKLVLNSALLSGWNAGSLIIGGERSTGSGSVSVNVRTTNLTLDNAGDALAGKDIVLVAKQNLTLAAGSVIKQTSAQTVADTFVVNGNGTLVRVSGVAGAMTSRTGVTTSALPQLNIGAGALISGQSILLDSSNATTLAPTAILTGSTINLNSGLISVLLDNHPGTPGGGLVLSGVTLANLKQAGSLALLSYTAIDFYGSGTFAAAGNLALHAGEIRSFNANGEDTNVSAVNLQLDNSANGTVPGAQVVAMPGKLNMTASGTMTIGQNALVIDQFSTVTLNAAQGLVMQGTGSLTVQNALNVVTPYVITSSNATQALTAGGELTLSQPGGTLATPTSMGLGGKLSLQGSAVTVNTALLLPSGLISVRALTGNVNVGGLLDARGVSTQFFDVTSYTNAGQITLTADLGDVSLAAGSEVHLEAQDGGGNAGTLVVNAGGKFAPQGLLFGKALKGTTASAEIDVGALPSFTAVNDALKAGTFTNEINLRVRSGSVTLASTDTVVAHEFLLGVDAGGITVNGTINASGQTGGRIDLIANGNVVLNSTAQLTVRGLHFDNAGKGGEIWIESGAELNGVVGTGRVTIAAGSTLDLSVADKVSGDASTVGSSAFNGQFSGKVHIRAPQSTTFNNILVDAIAGTFIDPSSIEVEGYRLYSYNQANVIIRAGTTTISGETLNTTTLNNDAKTFFGTGNANYNSMMTRLFATSGSAIQILDANGAALGTNGLVVIQPGVEIVNRGGNITLGSTTSSAYNNDWDLNTFRYGPLNAPGTLTLRAAGNLQIYNSISDGFQVATSGINPAERMWMAPLRVQNTALPLNSQSWSFRMVAGADVLSANFREVVPMVTKTGSGSSNVLTVSSASGIVLGQAVTGTNIATGTVVTAINGNQITLSQNLSAAVPANTSIIFGSSLLLGKNAVDAIGGNTSGGVNALTRLAINPTNSAAATASNFFQVIRTGTGDIEIYTAKDVQLLNQFATIYTAGVQVQDSSTVYSSGDFSVPDVTEGNSPDQGTTKLGQVQQLYPAQYSMAGGNVTVNAGNDIVHYTYTQGATPTQLLDSQRELPNNWLMRRSYVDATGHYGMIDLFDVFDESASATWWVNFSNFFDGIATLGGGNVSLNAGRDVQNVSAHAVTNARAAAGAATAGNLLELGGGDVTVHAGRNIDGGIYYVERGAGVLRADGAITTNSARAPGIGRLAGGTVADDKALTKDIYQNTWLPTTLFVGKSTFDVSARGNVLLGQTTNTMLLPQGLTNRTWYKTYFSTYSDKSAVHVSSLGGDITFRLEATLPQSTPQSLLNLWMNNELIFAGGSAANYQPWLRLVETSTAPFTTLTNLMPGTLTATTYTGNINVVGTMVLAPSASGTLELLAAGSFNGLAPTGVSSTIIASKQTNVWSAATINLSDADPDAIPTFSTPISYYGIQLNDSTLAGQSALNNALRVTSSTFLTNLNALFLESGSTTGSYASTQSKQMLHKKGLLHAADTSPLRIYARSGDISGVTLYSAKFSQILAQKDITDIALYIQNNRSTDVSVVASGQDIVAYNANSVLRSQAMANGNAIALGEAPKSGDIQINGPGTLQVLAGRNLNLGTGSNNPDGTGVGITSIGNGRNPYLPFAGADVIVGAGMGAAAVGIGGGTPDFGAFITYISTTATGARYLAELADILGVASVNLNDPLLTADQQKQLAMAVFYLALRDAGRDHNDPDSPNAGTYTDGYAAIAKLFPTTSSGSIQTQARDIRTKSGGNISILAPQGGLQLAATTIGSTLAPPGIITEAGGSINIFASNSVDIGIARIFTLKGGDITIWSSTGDIAAGSSSKTVQSAPPTRVLIDPQSANVSTDLAGLATGGGIGVLATVAGVRPGNVDLIAPIGAVDAGDAGIRATGNLNIAATIVLNSANISVGGTSAGTPAAVSVAAPSLGGLAAASSSAAAATSATNSQGPAQDKQQQALAQDQPSIISVEVIGYGGGNDERKRSNDQPGE